jgi:putative membrane protein
VRAHATTAAARTVAARYFNDHTAAQADLRRLASRLRVTVPTTPGVQHESMAAQIEAQKGRNLDTAFARAAVLGHQTAIAIFKKELSAGRNPAVRAYAARYLPVLQMHLSLAERAQSTLRVTPASMRTR